VISDGWKGLRTIFKQGMKDFLVSFTVTHSEVGPRSGKSGDRAFVGQILFVWTFLLCCRLSFGLAMESCTIIPKWNGTQKF